MERIRDLGLAVEVMTFPRILARQAERNGDRTYLQFEGRRWSYAELDRETDRIANGLREAGIGRGAHAAVMLDNCPEMLFVLYALGKLGAVSCPLNTASKGDLLAYFLNQSDSAAAIVGSRSWPRFAEVVGRAPQLKLAVDVVESGEQAPPVGLPASVRRIPFAEIRAAADGRPGVSVRPEDPQGIFFTSGTTGPSKAVLTTNAQSFTWAVGRVEFLGYVPEDTLYTCLPLFHLNALNSAAIAALVGDAQLALSRRFSAAGFWDEVRRTGATQFNLLGSMINILWAQPASPRDREHRVRQCGTVPVPLFAPEFEERFGVTLVTSYAITDAGQGTFLQPGYPREKMCSTGRPRPGVRIEIRDANDRPVVAGAQGEICMRADDPALASRIYYKMPEETAKANRGDWFHTGDRGYMDEDGYLWFVDRDKDSIRRRGENISAWEVEQAIGSHPAVMDVAVIPVRAEMSEDEVMACVVLRAGQALDAASLVRYCAERMAHYMVPRYVEFVRELPRTMSEKVQKRELRTSAESRIASIWDREKAGIPLGR